MTVPALARAARFCAAFPCALLLGCASEDGNAAGAPPGAGAQEAGLGAPTASFPEDFGAIQTVRELGDGRVLVADPLGGALYAVDMEAGTRTQIGTEGQGPEEYRQPDAVWALPGDSTLLVDLGNGRLTTLGPDLGFGATSPLSTGDPRSGLIVAIPQGVDRAGRIYARSMPGGMGAMPDSGVVLRVSRGSFELDSVARFKLEDRTVTRSGGANNQSVNVSPVPLSAQDAWGVAPDGSVVVARSADYSIEWHAPDATVTRGSPNPFEPISIGQAKKQEWSRAQGQSGGGLSISVEVNNGRMQTNFGRGRGSEEEDLNQYAWPEVAPPFYNGRLLVDGSDRVWVRRHVEPGDPTTYDVFGRDAERITTLTLPANKQVIAFGQGTVYVVAYDEFDLNYLERYAMPLT